MINTEYANLYKSNTTGKNLFLWYYVKTEVMYTVDSYFRFLAPRKTFDFFDFVFRVYGSYDQYKTCKIQDCSLSFNMD